MDDYGYSTLTRPTENGLTRLNGRYVLPYTYSFRGDPFENSVYDLGGPLLQTTTSYRGDRSGGVRGTFDPAVILSESNNSFWSPYDNGHTFWTSKENCRFPKNTEMLVGRNGTVMYTPVFPAEAPAFIGRTPQLRYQPPPINLNVGTEFLNQTRPTKSAANVAAALLELFVDLPKIPFDAIKDAKRVTDALSKGGGEYLNIVFGWQPLVQDVLKTCKAVVNAADIIRQYERDSGKQIRRRAFRPVSDPVTSQEVHFGLPTNVGNSGAIGNDLFRYSDDGVGTVTTEDTYTEKYTFSGAFMYLLTGDETFFGKMDTYGKLAAKLLGARLDIDVLWQIAPWSWLADWFGDFGSFIAVNNSIAMDNLVIRYGYLMREVHYLRTWTHTGITAYNGYHTGPVRASYLYVSKERVRATPYGFGLDPQKFSESQWAILAALGLTKGNRKFWWG